MYRENESPPLKVKVGSHLPPPPEKAEVQQKISNSSAVQPSADADLRLCVPVLLQVCLSRSD